MLTILLSPSKKLDESSSKVLKHSEISFKKSTLELIDIMQNYSKKDLQKLMNLSDNLAETNFQRFHSFKSEFSLGQGSKQALFLFKGDVYDKMDIENYSDSDIEFAQQHIRILSGLYGIIRPLDLIQPYRLEMGKKIVNSQGKNLYDFWQTKITKKINIENPNGVIVNLASNEYFKAINKKQLKANLVNINMKQLKDGKLKTIGIMAKRARGLMADYIIKNNLNNIEDLKNFSLEGYKFSAELSDKNNLTFILEM